MNRHVIEIVSFRLAEGVLRETFAAAAERANSFISACPGFVQRRLSVDAAGTWTDHVEWSSLAHAEAAASAIGAAEGVQDFLAAIDMSTIAMTHADLIVSAG